MHLLHTALNCVNNLLSPAGIAVARTQKTPWKWGNSIMTARIGRYSIEVPSSSPVAWHYSHAPDLVGQLGRLTSLLKKKYPDLSAMDIGANVGDTACIIKSAEDIPLLCIEGEEFIFSFLKKNIVQFSNTTAHQLFLGEKTGVASVVFENAGWNLTLKPGAGPSTTSIKLTSLDDFMATQPGGLMFKLLKIDTEGFDCNIIRGAMNFLRNFTPAITFEYNRGNMDAIGEPGLPTLFKLQELGYSNMIFHDQNGRFLLSATMADHALIKDLHEYADCVHGRTGYLDITVFHSKDADVAEAFLELERSRRRDLDHKSATF